MKNLPIAPYIWQGGMGVGISLKELVSKVVFNGGIGFLTTAALDTVVNYNYKTNFDIKEAVVFELTQIFNIVGEFKNRVGVNIMGKLRDSELILEGAIQAGAKIIAWGAGIPSELPKQVDTIIKKLYRQNKLSDDIIAKDEDIEKCIHEDTFVRHNINLVPIISNANMLYNLCKKIWSKFGGYTPDAVVVESPLAGGHIAWNANKIKRWPNINEKFDLLGKLIPEMLQTVKKLYEENITDKLIPIVAAGGIKDREGVQKAFSAGASAVQLGTRFLLSDESGATDDFKQAIKDTQKNEVLIPHLDVLSACDFTFSRSKRSPIYKDWENRTNQENKYFCICTALIKACGVEIPEFIEKTTCPYGYVDTNREGTCLARSNVLNTAIYTCGKIAEKIFDILPVKKIMEILYAEDYQKFAYFKQT